MPIAKKTIIPVDLNELTVRRSSAEIARTVNHPKFKRMLKEIDSTPIDDRLEKAIRLLNVDEMIKRGIPIARGTAVTLRIFEEINNPENPKSSDIDSFKNNPIKPQPLIVKVCLGSTYSFGKYIRITLSLPDKDKKGN